MKGVGVLRIGHFLYTQEQIDYVEEAYNAELHHILRIQEDEDYRNSPDCWSAAKEYAAFAYEEGFEDLEEQAQADIAGLVVKPGAAFWTLYNYVEQLHRYDAMAWC